jgi:hypothetical protein
MENLNIISNSLEYYDKNLEQNKDFYNSINYINIIKAEGNNYNDYNYIDFYDKNKNLIKKSKYEILGVYNSSNNIWTWGWSIAKLNKNNVVTSKKIFNYGFDLDSDNIYLKNELVTSRFKISNPIQLEIHVSIGAYLSKKSMVFSYKIYNDLISKKNVVSHNDLDLYNVKKNYENESYNEYFLLILD